MAALMRGAELQDLCMDVARDYVPKVAAGTPRESGETAASTHAEEDRMPDGTAGSKVVQSGAGVQQNFGNEHTRAQHHLHRALGNGA